MHACIGGPQNLPAREPLTRSVLMTAHTPSCKLTGHWPFLLQICHRPESSQRRSRVHSQCWQSCNNPRFLLKQFPLHLTKLWSIIHPFYSIWLKHDHIRLTWGFYKNTPAWKLPFEPVVWDLSHNGLVVNTLIAFSLGTTWAQHLQYSALVEALVAVTLSEDMTGSALLLLYSGVCMWSRLGLQELIPLHLQQCALKLLNWSTFLGFDRKVHGCCTSCSPRGWGA